MAAGKSDTGTLELNAFHEGGSIIIEVKDDGGGLDKARILAKAHDRYCEALVTLGTHLPQTRDQTKAQVELFQTAYREALLRVIPRPE